MTSRYQSPAGWLDWGRVKALPEDEQIKVVRDWLAEHQPIDLGDPRGAGARRWLERRGAIETQKPADPPRQSQRQEVNVPAEGDVWERLRQMKAVNTYGA